MEPAKKSKHELRSEETKRNIAEAAGRLFTTRGYDTVTMREIAKEAGCSHTTIYLYFKDKEALLEQLAIPPLQALETAFVSVMNQVSLAPPDKLLEISRQFLRFCLSHKSMVPVIFNVNSVRVDDPNPPGEVNQLRVKLFGYLTAGMNQIIPSDSPEESVNLARVYFFMMNGMVMTYLNSEEPLEALLERILPLLEQSVEIVLLGMKQKQKDKQKQKQKDKEQQAPAADPMNEPQAEPEREQTKAAKAKQKKAKKQKDKRK